MVGWLELCPWNCRAELETLKTDSILLTQDDVSVNFKFIYRRHGCFTWQTEIKIGIYNVIKGNRAEYSTLDNAQRVKWTLLCGAALRNEILKVSTFL
jgi:hypothetical protein